MANKVPMMYLNTVKQHIRYMALKLEDIRAHCNVVE